MNFEAMDAETVAALLDVKDRQLRNYCKDGCPFEQRGKQRVFTWSKVLQWYIEYKATGEMPIGEATGEPDDADEPGPGRKENLTQANLRKTRAEADLKQLLLAQKRGQVVSVADARAILDRLFGNLKSQLLGAAPLLNTRLEGEADSIAREAAIREFMENLCRELATGKIVRDAIAETDTPEAEADEEEEETISNIKASADEVTDEDLDEALNEWLAAHLAVQKADRES